MADVRKFADEHPLKALPQNARVSSGAFWAPRVELTVGRDPISGGLCIVGYLVSEDGLLTPRVLFTHRWKDSPQSIDECLLVAYRGLLAFFEEAGIQHP